MRSPRRRTALTLAALAGVLTAGCREQRTAPRLSAAPSTEGGAPWEILFERDVSGNVDLYVIGAGGGRERRLTDHPAADMLGRWTPDGASVIFSSNRTGTSQLFEVAAEGGKPRRLRENNADESQSDVSPDGATLAFLSDFEGPPRLLVMSRASGVTRDMVRQGTNTIFGNPHWSPDGRFIAYSSNWRIGHQIYVVEVATGQRRRISRITSGGCEARFSPDGRRLVYVSRGHLGDTSRLLEHELATGREKVLVSWPALNYDAAYSPDGTEIAFASNVTGDWAIYRQRLADGRAWRVTFGPGAARYPDYRPVPSGRRR